MEELKKRLIDFLKPQLEEIKAENKPEEIETAIFCILAGLISCEIFGEKELNDKEDEIFFDTYSFMLDFAPTINETIEELHESLNDEIISDWEDDTPGSHTDF